MSRTTTHKKACRIHADQRMRERYQGASAEVREAVRKRIKKLMKTRRHTWQDAPDCRIISKTTPNRPHFKVQVGDTWYRVVWDIALAEIVTFLPPAPVFNREEEAMA